MSRILLISPLSDRFNGIGNFGSPALGVWRLRAVARASEHWADVWDCNLGREIKKCSTIKELVEEFYSHMVEQFDLNSYDWFGFSILNDTLPLTLGLANLLKLKHPMAEQVAGNAEATLNYQDIFDKSKIDAVLVGEADFSLPPLLSGQDPRSIKGIHWFQRGGRMSPEEFYDAYGKMNFGDMPLIPYGIKTMRLYAQNKTVTDARMEDMLLRRISPEDASRELGMELEPYVKQLYSCMTLRWVTMDHCPLPCTYCSTARIPDYATGQGVKMATFIPTEAVADLARKAKREIPGLLAIYDDSDETFLGTERGLKYAKVLQSIKSEMDLGTPRGFRWLVQTRTNEMTQELVHELALGGVQHLTFGVENASAYVRDSIRKRQDDQKILDLIGWCKEAGVACYYLLILFPPETRIVDLETNVRVIREWVRLGATVSAEPFLMPYRGTPILDDPRYHYEHVAYDVPFSSMTFAPGAPLKKLKWPTLVLPRDPDVRALMMYFRATLDDAIEERKKAAGHQHTFKGFTGIVCVDHLAHCLELWHAGKIRADGTVSAVGEVRPVYQEYATRESGVEMKMRSKEETMQSANGRFNPSHSSIDGEAVKGLKQGAIKTRLQKDANAEAE